MAEDRQLGPVRPALERPQIPGRATADVDRIETSVRATAMRDADQRRQTGRPVDARRYNSAAREQSKNEKYRTLGRKKTRD